MSQVAVPQSSQCEVDLGSMTISPVYTNSALIPASTGVITVPLHYNTPLLTLANVWVPYSVDAVGSLQIKINSGAVGTTPVAANFYAIAGTTWTGVIAGTSSVNAKGYEVGFYLQLTYSGSGVLSAGTFHCAMNDVC